MNVDKLGMNDLESRINDLIPRGSQRTMTAKALAQLTKTDKRTVMNVINRLIVKYRIPIVGVRMGKYGYFKPVNADEMREAIRPLQSQTAKELERLSILEEILKEMEA